MRFVAEDSNYYRDYIVYKNFGLNYGFGWFVKDKDEVFVYLDFCIYKGDKSKEEVNKLVDKFKGKFDELYDNDDAISLGFSKPLKEFSGEQKEQKNVIVKQLNDWITKTKQFKDENPELFNA